MHMALSSNLNDPEFNPEPFSLIYQRSLYQTLRSQTRNIFQLLKNKEKLLQENLQSLVKEVLSKESNILTFYKKIIQKKISGLRIRTHGDYHLGQVLYTGKDFYIIDFEEESHQSMSGKRIKKSPLRDVAGMSYSFHYAAQKALLSHPVTHSEQVEKLEHWADIWYQHVNQTFLQAYKESIEQSKIPLLPKDQADCDYLLQTYMMNKVIYELAFEINTQPDLAIIPLKAMKYLLN